MAESRFNFRAYINKLNKVYNVLNLLYGGEMIECVDNEGEFVVNELNSKEEFVLMQSTGLVDKNGKEIYEGDIIKDDYRKYKIMWYAEEAKFAAFDVIDHKYFCDGDCEVIGNIYENKEIME